MAVSKIVRVAREKGIGEVGRRAAWGVLNGAGRALVRASERFTPDHTMALTPDDRALVQSNARFKNLHSGRRCFVIGNGPSLQREDLTPLAGEITFVMNGFFDNPILSDWKPTYHCLSDPAYFNGAEPTEMLRRGAVREEGTTFFAPLHFRDDIERGGLIPSDFARYILFRGELKDAPPREIDLTSFVPSVWSVSELCIMIAMFMGCSPVYLLGLDHDWLAHRREYADWQKYSYKFIIEFQHKLWCGYENLADLAKRTRTEILNATEGSFLDVFPTAVYRSLVFREQDEAAEQSINGDRPLRKPASAGVA